MLQRALSRKVGSPARAKNSRSTSSSATTMTTSPPRARGLSMTANGPGTSGEVEGEPEHDVDREQLQALEPRRLALLGHLVGDDDRHHHGGDLEPVEDE